MFIKLTCAMSGGPVIIRADYVTKILGQGTGSDVICVDGDIITVKEDPETVRMKTEDIVKGTK